MGSKVYQINNSMYILSFYSVSSLIYKGTLRHNRIKDSKQSTSISIRGQNREHQVDMKANVGVPWCRVRILKEAIEGDTSNHVKYVWTNNLMLKYHIITKSYFQ